MQVYKHMDIGTAKPDAAEMEGIPHYLIDEVFPDEEFSVARYKELALKYIKEVHGKNKIPVVVGGTGLYINSLVYNINFSETETDWELRDKLKRDAEERGNLYLHQRLAEVDPEAAAKIHFNNVKRVVRALEVFEKTKKTITSQQEESRLVPPEHSFIIFGLSMDREKLYDRINLRVDSMFRRGLLEEVEGLVRIGYDKNTVAMQGIGYKEVLSYIRGEISLEDAVYIIKRDTRRYAKRQITWFKRLENVHWISMDKHLDVKEIIKIMKDCIESSGIFL